MTSFYLGQIFKKNNNINKYTSKKCLKVETTIKVLIIRMVQSLGLSKKASASPNKGSFWRQKPIEVFSVLFRDVHDLGNRENQGTLKQSIMTFNKNKWNRNTKIR
jgi:hypothetical protein